VTTIHANFVADLWEHQRDLLAALGHDVSGIPPHECAQLFFNLRARTIWPAPRRVHEACGLSCPDEMKTAFRFFKLKAIAGEDLNAHLSRKLKDASYTDGLLTEWGVQHFHLSMTKDKDGFIKRHDEVLFGRVTATDIYLAHFGKHKRTDGGSGFIALEIVEALHKNWPDTIAQYLVEDGGTFVRNDPTTGKQIPLTPQEQADLVREANMSAAVKVSDGASYLINPRTMGGYGLDQWYAAANAVYAFEQVEAHARSVVEALVAASLPAGTSPPDELRLKLFFDADGKPHAQEKATGTIVPIPDVRV
jgi:hypothetical protein